jgi:hypothetical protein
VMNRLESGAASCGLFLETQRVTVTGESPTHANAAALPEESVHSATTPMNAMRGNFRARSLRLFHNIIITPIVHSASC